MCTTLRHTSVFTYSHANTPLGQSERAFYLSYFINNNKFFILSIYFHGASISPFAASSGNSKGCEEKNNHKIVPISQMFIFKWRSRCRCRRCCEIRDTKSLNLSRNVVSLQVFVDVSRFSPCTGDRLVPQQMLKKGVAKSRALVNFEQQILALFLVFHRTHNLSRNKCRHIRSTPTKLTNQRATFLQPATNLLLRDRLITQGEERETSTQNLQRNNVCATSWGFLWLVFRRF